jgi:hypothetical protein
LLGVPYDGLKSPAGYLHADLMPVVRALTESRERVERQQRETKRLYDRIAVLYDLWEAEGRDSLTLAAMEDERLEARGYPPTKRKDIVARRDALSTPDSDRCPTCGLTVKIPASKGSHGCPDPWHEEAE